MAGDGYVVRLKVIIASCLAGDGDPLPVRHEPHGLTPDPLRLVARDISTTAQQQIHQHYSTTADTTAHMT